jgi:hypothetical protein
MVAMIDPSKNNRRASKGRLISLLNIFFRPGATLNTLLAGVLPKLELASPGDNLVHPADE